MSTPARDNESELAEEGRSEAASPAQGRATLRVPPGDDGLFVFGRSPEEDEIREMYGWGV